MRSLEGSTIASTELEDFRSFIRSLIAPIRSIPNEILGLVFELYVDNRRLSLAYKDPIWLLTRVCRVWRKVALSSPWLWTRIDTRRLPKYVPPKVKSRLGSVDMREVCDVLQSYLAHSRSLPLEINLYLWPSSRWKPVVQMLWEHRQRWQTLHCRGGRTQELEQVRQEMSSDGLPVLRSYQYASDGDAKDIAGLLCLLPAPKLRNLRLWGRCQTIDQSLPWSQITCYSGPAVTHAGHKILPLMTNLQSCVVHFIDFDYTTWGNSTCLFCPRLRVLSFYSHYEPHTCAAYISAPMLRKLSNTLYFIDISARHGSALSTLSIGYGCDDAVLYEIIKHCPTLRTLVLRQSPARIPAGTIWRPIFAQLKDTPALFSHLIVLKVVPVFNRSTQEINAQVADAMQLVKTLLALDTRCLQAVHFHGVNVESTRRMLDQEFATVIDNVKVTVHGRGEYQHADDFGELVRLPLLADSVHA
ncbi:hypothetical protein EV122DRAFT_207944 [Schizophyllum commune]